MGRQHYACLLLSSIQIRSDEFPASIDSFFSSSMAVRSAVVGLSLSSQHIILIGSFSNRC